MCPHRLCFYDGKPCHSPYFHADKEAEISHACFVLCRRRQGDSRLASFVAKIVYVVGLWVCCLHPPLSAAHPRLRGYQVCGEIIVLALWSEAVPHFTRIRGMGDSRKMGGWVRGGGDNTGGASGWPPVCVRVGWVEWDYTATAIAIKIIRWQTLPPVYRVQYSTVPGTRYSTVYSTSRRRRRRRNKYS